MPRRTWLCEKPSLISPSLPVLAKPLVVLPLQALVLVLESVPFNVGRRVLRRKLLRLHPHLLRNQQAVPPSTPAHLRARKARSLLKPKHLGRRRLKVLPRTKRTTIDSKVSWTS